MASIAGIPEIASVSAFSTAANVSSWRDAWRRQALAVISTSGSEAPSTSPMISTARNPAASTPVGCPWVTQPEIIANEHTKLTRAGTPIGANAMARFVRAVYRNAQKKTRGLPADLPTSGVDWNEEVPRKLALAPGDLPAWERERLALKNLVQRELALFLLLSGLCRRDACSASMGRVGYPVSRTQAA
jgi:hypothetical protein